MPIYQLPQEPGGQAPLEQAQLIRETIMCWTNMMTGTTPLPPTFILNLMNMSKQYFFTKLQPVPLARANGGQFNDLYRSRTVIKFKS